jgi:hypothetical protein
MKTRFDLQAAGFSNCFTVQPGNGSEVPLALSQQLHALNRCDVPQIDVRGCEAAVTELLLDHVRTMALRHQFGGLGLPESMRVDAHLECQLEDSATSQTGLASTGSIRPVAEGSTSVRSNDAATG